LVEGTREWEKSEVQRLGLRNEEQLTKETEKEPVRQDENQEGRILEAKVYG
jgi:hypothetical protein